MNTKPQCECVALLHLWDVELRRRVVSAVASVLLLCDVELRRGVISAVASVLLLCDVEMTRSHSACVFCGVELI